jgi:hypothetical protein
MKVEVPEEGTTEDHEQVRIPRDRPLGFIHSGNRYAFGYGPDLYGIWDAASSGPPIQEFPPTDQGRQEGWRRYLELEPSAEGTNISPASPDEVWRREVAERKSRGRRNGLIIMGAVVVAIVGIIVFVAVSAGGGGPAASEVLSAAAAAKKAHVEIAGTTAITDDLTQTSFTATSPKSLIGASDKGVWKGTQVELTIDVHNPVVGTLSTTTITNRTVTIAFTQADGTTATLFSTNGECKITLDNVVDAGFSGSFDCTGLPIPGGTDVVDVKGDFGAST